MKTRVAIYAAAAVTMVYLAAPASAQGVLPPHEITVSVRSMGLQPISRPVFRNGRYILRAIDGRGCDMRVVANAFTGRVLAVRPLGYPAGPVYAERFYPPARYPAEAIPIPPGYVRVPPPPGASERAARIPSDPSVIFAPGSRPPASASKPAAKPAVPSKVAAKPAKPPAEAKPADGKSQEDKPAEQPADTTGATASSPPENSAVAVPPVQTLE